MTPTELHPVLTERGPALPPAAVCPERSTDQSPWLMHLMPSFTDIAFLVPLIFLFAKLDGVRTMLGDGDTGWHILTGQWILAHHQVPHQDIFSFTKAGQPWFAWEWLWDVAAAWVYGHGGLGAVVLANVIVICVTFALLYRLAFRRCGNPLVAIAVTSLAAAGSSIHWLARPHLFSMLFMVIFLAILDRVREGQTRLLWLLPPLMVLWTNLHGGFFIGMILTGAYAGGELVRALLAGGRGERIAGLRASLPYILVTAACALATLVNPYFYHLQEHILKYLNDPFQLRYILEFQSTNFRNGAAIYFEAMLALGLGAAVWYTKRKQYTEALLILGWGHLALIIVRNVPIFMIAAVPVVALPVLEWLNALSRAPIAAWLRGIFGAAETVGAEIETLERPWRLHVVCVVVLALLATAINSPAAGKKFKPEYDPERYPSGALALLQQPGQRIFTHDEWGDYLLFNLWPKGVKVYVDGRSDFYGPDFGQDYIDVLNVKYDWEQKLDCYGVNTILMPTDAPLVGAIKESSHWRVIFDDTRTIVFRSTREAGGGVRRDAASCIAEVNAGGNKK